MKYTTTRWSDLEVSLITGIKNPSNTKREFWFRMEDGEIIYLKMKIDYLCCPGGNVSEDLYLFISAYTQEWGYEQHLYVHPKRKLSNDKFRISIDLRNYIKRVYRLYNDREDNYYYRNVTFDKDLKYKFKPIPSK